MEPEAGELVRTRYASTPTLDDPHQLLVFYVDRDRALYPRGTYFVVLERHRWMMAPDGRIFRYRSLPLM